MTRVVLVGGGEHACVVADAALAAGTWTLVGFSDVSGDALVAHRFGLRYLGSDADAAREHRDAAFAIAVGTRAARLRALSVLESNGVRFATIVHPNAVIAPTATLEGGALVLAGAVINTGAVIGAHAIVNTGAIIEHDVRVGRLAHICPAAAIGGGATIGAHAVVGLGARVRDHVNVMEGAFVGMGAVVVEQVEADGIVVGVPARPITHREAPSSGRPM